MSLYRIKIGGKTYEMEIELIEEGNPKKKLETPKGEEPRPAPVPEKTAEAGPNTITAPMPGNILQIMVKPGDMVAEGDVLLLLEAMKMENEVCAPKAGKVSAVFVAEGQTVAADAPLMELEA